MLEIAISHERPFSVSSETHRKSTLARYFNLQHMYMICALGSSIHYAYVCQVSLACCVCKVGGGRDPLFSGTSHVEVPKRLDMGAN